MDLGYSNSDLKGNPAKVQQDVQQEAPQGQVFQPEVAPRGRKGQARIELHSPGPRRD